MLLGAGVLVAECWVLGAGVLGAGSAGCSVIGVWYWMLGSQCSVLGAGVLGARFWNAVGWVVGAGVLEFRFLVGPPSDSHCVTI